MVVDRCTLRFGSRRRVHRDCLSVHLPFDGHMLSSQTYRTIVVPFEKLTGFFYENPEAYNFDHLWMNVFSIMSFAARVVARRCCSR
jgi:hypothetical protein